MSFYSPSPSYFGSPSPMGYNASPSDSSSSLYYATSPGYVTGTQTSLMSPGMYSPGTSMMSPGMYSPGTSMMSPGMYSTGASCGGGSAVKMSVPYTKKRRLVDMLR